MKKAIDRIMDEIAKKGLKASAVERELSLSNGYIATMKKRNGSLTEEVLVKFSDYLNFSLNYLIRGVEDPNSPKTKEPKPKIDSMLIDALNGQIEVLKDALKDKNDLIDILKKEIGVPEKEYQK